MTDNHFDMVLVWDHLGSSVRVKPFGQAQVLDPATNVPVTVVQNGQSTSVVTADGTGRASFVAQQGLLKLVSGGLVQLVTSPEAATQGAANAAAAQTAQAAAQTAQAAAEKAASDAKVNSDAATTTANTAKSTADTAKSTADSALSTANATQAQQTQLMTVTPTVDELVATTVITTWQSPGQAVTQNETAGGVHSIWIAPFPCRIVQASFLWDYWSLAANDTNYITFQLRRNHALTYTTMVTKTTKVTGGEAVVQRVPWKFAGAAWDSAASTFAEGDVLVMQNTFTGTGLTHSFPLTMTWRYVPL